MKSLDRNKFLKPVVETRILEKRLLSRGSFDKMLQAKELRQIRTLLDAAGYRQLFAQEGEEAHIPALLDACMADFLEEILSISPPDAIEYLDLLFFEYDLHNILAAFMRREEGAQASNRSIPLPRERAARYEKLLEGAEAVQVQEANDRYAQLMHDAKLQAQKSPRTAQQWLDREYFKHLHAVATASGIPLFVEYAQTKADFYNILLLLRLRRMQAASHDVAAADARALYGEIIGHGGAIARESLLDLFVLSPEGITRKLEQTRYRKALSVGIERFGYGQETALLERDMDNYLTRLVRDARYTPIGPEPLFGYLHARRMELINLRLIFAVRLQGLPGAAARERMRETYA